jgi:hypothetical protein
MALSADDGSLSVEFARQRFGSSPPVTWVFGSRQFSSPHVVSGAHVPWMCPARWAGLTAPEAVGPPDLTSVNCA